MTTPAQTEMIKSLAEQLERELVEGGATIEASRHTDGFVAASLGGHVSAVEIYIDDEQGLVANIMVGDWRTKIAEDHSPLVKSDPGDGLGVEVLALLREANREAVVALIRATDDCEQCKDCEACGAAYAAYAPVSGENGARS